MLSMPFTLLIRGVRVLGVAERRPRPGIEAARVRRVLHEAYRAAEGARAVERALRAAQDLDPVEVLQPQVEVERRVIDIGRDRRHDGRRQRQLTRRAPRCSGRE